jgi:deoxyribose-phosphate aldolase
LTNEQASIPEQYKQRRPIQSYIDHTNLKPNATREDIETLCREAIEHHFYAVCVNLCRLDLCVQMLHETSVKIAVVVGFPLGATSTHIKFEETKEALDKGANEIDMVINIGKLLDGEYLYVYEEIHKLAQLCNHHKALLKCILETSQLPSLQTLIDACLLCLLAGAHFVKTCTGFMGGGATLEHVQIMRSVVGYNSGVQVKASGGVRTFSDAVKLIEEGHIDRIGTSSGIAIISGEKQDFNNEY